MSPRPAPPDRSRRWTSFGTTADVGIRAQARTPAGLYEASGLGMIALMTDLRRVRSKETRTLRAQGADPSALLVSYLSELLGVAHGDEFLPRRMRVRLTGSPPTALVAEMDGEAWDLERHSHRIDVKAATFHRLALDLRPGHCRARFIVDI